MNDVIVEIERLLQTGETDIALATVIETWGSAPRKAGSKMAFTEGGGSIAGSVSGGCVEGAVIEAGSEVLATGRPKILHFGVSDEQAWDVGLACGGTIEVLVERLDPDIFGLVRECISGRNSCSVITILKGPERLMGRKLVTDEHGNITGSLSADLDSAAVDIGRQTIHSTRRQLTDEVEIFVDALRPSPTLVMVGGAHIAIALAAIAKLMNYRTILIDPRRAFGNGARFPDVDQLVQSYPETAFQRYPLAEDHAVVTLSHDPKIDDPALRAALDSSAFYIGALGSRRTIAKRNERLRALGISDEQLARIHAPIGLDIGADSPEEIALAIMSEVVSVYRQQPEAAA